MPDRLLVVRPWAAILLAALVAGPADQTAFGKEPAEDFVRGLQERGLNELALDYLELMKTSAAVDEDFRKSIPYLRGLVLIEQSRQAPDGRSRSELLENARKELERFAESNPNNINGANANLELGSVQLAGGRQLVAQAGQLPNEAAYDGQKRELNQSARELFGSARSLFEQAETVYAAEIEKLPPTNPDEESDGGNKRQEYRTRIAQLRFLAAQTQFELAQSYPAEADEFRDLTKAAAAELSAVYEEFGRTFIVGLYARLYEGRCYQALGDTQLALGCYDELLKQSNVLPPFRKLIASAVHRKAEVLIADEKFGEAIETCQVCLRDAKPEEERQLEWLAVRFRLGEALRGEGESLAAGSMEQRKRLAEARDAYRFVSNSPGDFQSAARTLVTALNKETTSADESTRVAPKTFQAAYELGKDALASYNAAKLALPSAQKNNPAAVPELDAQMQQGKSEAREYFRAAATMVDDDTDPKLLNEVRYFLCWLYWENADYYRAAVLGEFLARRYPDHPAAASAAKLAMASYERLLSEVAAEGNKDADNAQFESAKMASIADFITRRWPNTADADAAQSVLVSFAIRNNRIEEAEKLLAAASDEARPRLELQLGVALWGRYLELSKPGANQNDPAALAKLKESAVRYLQSGFNASRKNSAITESIAAAGLYLAQSLLSEEKYEEAIELLEDSKIGPLTLVADGSPAASRSQYAIEAYKAALRAYVLSSPPQEKKAVAIMKSLDELISAGGGSSDQLTQIYVGMSIALEKQAAQLRAAGRVEDAQRITSAFAQFLDHIAAREASAKWPVRAWLAQTYYNMGAGERASLSANAAAPVPQPKTLSDQDRDYLTKARDAYRKLLADAAENPKLAPNETSVLAARLQLGACLRELGEYEQALNTFSAVLKERESSLAVQRSAAQTYQDRGQMEHEKWLENAIHGGHKLKTTGQNRIWGWLKIAQVAARAARSDPKYRDAFFEARYNVARCRYLAAMKQKGDMRKRDLAKAKQSIQSLAQVYPELGGDQWRGQFDSMLKRIQSAAGQKPAGLSEFSIVEPAPPSGRSG